MANRNFSMKSYWMNKAREHQPALSFVQEDAGRWKEWHDEARQKLLHLLGDFPQKVDLAAEIEYSVEDGDLIRERVIFDSESYASVPCIVLRPKKMEANRNHAAIICCNGHPVDLGKDPVGGVRASGVHDELIALRNYNYGEQMARAGYLTIMPELRGFGERNDTCDKHDVCDINYVKGSILGVYPLALNVWDMKCCIDYLETRPEVNPQRIGMMGLSFGGTVTTFTAAVDPRIKAADVMGYVNPFRGFGLERGNFCGSQVVPNLYQYLDTHDVAGLIAPRPLLVEMGMYDDCFFIQDLLEGYSGIQRIYEAAGA